MVRLNTDFDGNFKWDADPDLSLDLRSADFSRRFETTASLKLKI